MAIESLQLKSELYSKGTPIVMQKNEHVKADLGEGKITERAMEEMLTF